MMDIKIYNPAFDLEGVIDFVKEYDYTEEFNDYSEFHIRVPSSDKNRELFITDNYIAFADKLFLIDRVVTSENEIYASGVSIFALFRDVLIEEPQVFKTNPYDTVVELAKLISIPYATYEVYTMLWNSDIAYTQINCVNTSVYTEIRNICNIYGFGFDIAFSPALKRIMFQIMPKQKRYSDGGSFPYAISDMRNMYERCSVESNMSSYKNYAHIPYGYIDDVYTYENVDHRVSPTNERKRAISVSVPNMLSSRDLSTSLRYLGELALSHHREIIRFTVELIKDVDASPGDVCDFECKRDGYFCHALVIRITRGEKDGAEFVRVVLDKEHE